jgi:mono/diheme cytochrome c family protein
VGTAVVIVALTSRIFAGGWAAITLNEWPEYVVAGRPVTLTFAVRQHGVTLLDGLKPQVHARSATGAEVHATAKPAGKTGEYAAKVTLTNAGDWRMTIDSGFLSRMTTLPPLHVISANAAPPSAMAAAVRGAQLFVAKGCIACHLHEDVTPEPTAFAWIDLTGKRFAAGYVERFLADPGIKPPPKSGIADRMPNLNLEPAEIASLAAFINKH